MRLRNRALAAVCLPALAAPCGGAAQDAPRGRRDQALRQEITSELRLATARGFKFLLRRQEPSGDFDTVVPVAANALVGLALLAGGTTEETGPAEYVAALKKCTAALLARLAGRRLSADGVLLIDSRAHRTQAQNRAAARERLAELLRQAAVRPRKRKKTRPTGAAKERRLDAKSRRGRIKASRSRVRGDD